MTRLSFVLAAAATLVLPLSGLAAETPAAAPNLAPAVTVVRAADREIVERAIVTGTLVPREEVLVAPEVEGLRVTEVLVEEGAVVGQGDVLARLSRDILETTLAQNGAAVTRAQAAIAQANSQIIQAEAAQVEAQQALERTRALIRGGNATEVQLEQRVSAARAAEGRLAAARDGLRMAEAELRSSEAQRQETQVRLARTEIKAPRGGIVSRKNVRLGATATAVGDPLFRIIADGEIELEGEVTETQIGRIRAGAPALVTVDQNRPVEGRVRNVFPEVDRATRLGTVRISLTKDAPIRIGSFARGTVELARRTGVAIPTASVLYGQEGATVQVVQGDKVQSRRVKVGLSADSFVQIESGIGVGDLVVAKAGSFLRDGDTVRPILNDKTAQAEGAQ